MNAIRSMAYGEWAIFDVDETLISCKSMFSFLNFCFSEVYGQAAGAHAYMAFTEELHAMATRLPRADVNRAFYRVFKGWRLASLAQLAREWFDQEMQLGLFYQASLDVLRRHQHMGHQVVLLSGSADFILAPLAAYLQVEHLLAIHLQEDGAGVLTGEIDGIQTIGTGKRDALAALLATVAAERAPVLHGYGDHESDAPFLALCDARTIVLSHPDAPGAAPWHAGWNTLQVHAPVPPRNFTIERSS